MAAREAAYRPRAAYDIESIVVYVGQVLGLPQTAKDWYDQLQETLDMLADLPAMGKPFDDELLAHRDMHTFRVGQYRLFYTHDECTLTLWRVLHTRRDTDDYALMFLDSL